MSTQNTMRCNIDTVNHQNLDGVVKATIGIAPQSIMQAMAEKLEDEGADSVLQFLRYLHKACRKEEFGPYDDYMTDIVRDCYAIADAAERRLCCRVMESPEIC